MSFLTILIKKMVAGKLLKILVKTALKAYVNKTETPVDDAIYSIIDKIVNDQDPTQEIEFLIFHFGNKNDSNRNGYFNDGNG